MPSATPEISIIVPVYNAERYLRPCIDSILAQSFPDFELLLVNDGSTDGSAAICDEYAGGDHRVRAIHKQPNGGVSEARNTGLDEARGQWIAFIDADDWIDPDYLEALLKPDDADIRMCGFRFRYPDGKCEEEKNMTWTGDRYADLSRFIQTQWTVIWGCLISRQLIEKNALRFLSGITWCEDYHFMIRCIYLSRKVKTVDRILYNYRQNDSSICHNMPTNAQSDALAVYDDTIRFLKKHQAYTPLRKALAYRSLRHTHVLALDTSTFDIFLAHNPDKSDYILSCPDLNTKMKIIAWCLTHHMRPICAVIVGLRKLLGR